MNVDVVVAGGGLIGCATAWRLARDGAAVVVVDPGSAAGVASTAAGGMLAPLAEADAPGAFLDLALTSLRLYPEFVRDIEAAAGMSVDYEQEGKLIGALTAAQDDALRAMHAWLKRAHLPAERMTGAEARILEPALTPSARTGLLIHDDHRVDNVRLTSAAARAAARAGVRFMPGAVDEVIVERDGVVGVRLRDGDVIDTRIVIIAAGAWSGDVRGLPERLPVNPVRGQMLELHPPQPLFRRTIAGPGAYLVPRRDGRVVVGSTEEHAGWIAETTPEAIEGLRSAANALVPELADAPQAAAWAGLRPGTPDGLPILGADERTRGLLYATGHFRNGILLAPVTAYLVAQIAAGAESPELLSPFTIHRFAEPPGAHVTPTRARTRPGQASPTASAAPMCDVCGAEMYEMHCKLICRACGFRRDCSDP